ncbi:TetR/AcrR family transcriptional regulator [Rhodococcus globerulus]|uniref:TetR/AcrR family transcriptional regulator n=1 Tax=Rhodococcus globerulus TaxID=33008 RepID=UPI001112A6B1|nr:TetR/AcrR family transcriptional regulator [Rhodococcus globerulus]
MSRAIPPPNGRGRPIDPDIEARILAATLELYGDLGWARLNLDLIARHAKVGKAALYRRWQTKEQIMSAALRSSKKTVIDFDTGSLRGDLVAIGQATVESLLGEYGSVRMRAMIDAKIYPELFEGEIDELRNESIAGGREIILRAIKRGEIAKGTSPALILDAVAGTIEHHFLMTPMAKLKQFKSGSDKYIESVVDFVLAGLNCHSNSTAK